MSPTVIHAHVETLRRGAPPAQSLAWSNGRIIAVGPRSEVMAQLNGTAREIELGDRTVTPGFIDAHHHAGIAALYGGRVKLAAPRVTDIESLQTALAEAAAMTAPGRWVIATEWSELKLRERRAPTRAELDEAVPNHPLFAMHYSCHRGVANSRAFAAAGITAHSPRPQGGDIDERTGLLVERGISVFETLARADLIAHDAEELISRLGEHDRALLSVGITRLADAAVPTDLFSIYEAAHERGLARVPTTLMPVSVGGWLEAPLDVVEAARITTRARTLSVGPVKMAFDGAHSCAMCLKVWQSAAVLFRTAALSLRHGTLDPLRSATSLSPRLSGGRIRTGILMYQKADATQTVQRALERGFVPATHAEGNEAVDVVLEAYEAAGSRLHAHGQARIEHGIFLEPRHIERMAALGVALVVQPSFLTLPEFAHTPSIPGVYIKPLRRLLDAGVWLVASSDYPVVAFDPLLGIRSALKRPQLDPHQATSLDEALAMYTRNAAQTLGVANECGTLEVGKRADFLLFDVHLDSRSVHQATVAATVLDGNLVSGQLTGAIAKRGAPPT